MVLNNIAILLCCCCSLINVHSYIEIFPQNKIKLNIAGSISQSNRPLRQSHISSFSRSNNWYIYCIKNSTNKRKTKNSNCNVYCVTVYFRHNNNYASQSSFAIFNNVYDDIYTCVNRIYDDIYM